MSTPVQLLLFASDQVDAIGSDLVCLDNWFVFRFILKIFFIFILFRIMLNMNIDIASKIVAIRPAIEALIIRATQEPNQIINRPQSVEQLCNLIRLLSDQQLEHVLCEKINENNDTRQVENSNFK
jgi:ATP-dependent RNA helicase A